MKIDRSILNDEDRQKIEYLGNSHVNKIIETYVNIMRPSSVKVITDKQEEIDFVRNRALELGEERELTLPGHTIHYDGYYDQGRDTKNTRVLVIPEQKMSKVINTMDREAGLKEILGIMEGIMEGKEAVIRFFSLGPVGSKFSILAFQITDSYYVAHSEDILYRTAYEAFKKLDGSGDFFTFIHSSGVLGDRGVTKYYDKRRVFIDLKGDTVFTVNNQYAGNSLGLKKLALRLAIYKANRENWLAEHMFLMGAKPEEKNRITYFAGAFPSACGKTSTAMIPGQTIVGDDIIYMRESGGLAYAVNIEQGIFGIITDVNPEDDPLIYETLTTPRELIFSNVLVKDGVPGWLNMGRELPSEGMNHFSENWTLGTKDKEGKVVEHAHKNARYTMRLQELENVDPNLNDPDGVRVHGIIYGGRDSDTSVPVYQSLDWAHGVFTGATIESETTSATLGKEGVRSFSPMANMDFLVVPLGTYIRNHLRFGKSLDNPPMIFATNYFLKEKGRFLNHKVDKKVWLMWMEGRVYGEYDAIETPIGYIPGYEDIKMLFRQIFNREYTKADYDVQFAIRVSNWIEKMERMEKIYAEEDDVPEEFNTQLKEEKKRLRNAKTKYGRDIIPPDVFLQEKTKKT